MYKLDVFLVFVFLLVQSLKQWGHLSNGEPNKEDKCLHKILAVSASCCWKMPQPSGNTASIKGCTWSVTMLSLVVRCKVISTWILLLLSQVNIGESCIFGDALSHLAVTIRPLQNSFRSLGFFSCLKQLLSCDVAFCLTALPVISVDLKITFGGSLYYAKNMKSILKRLSCT